MTLINPRFPKNNADRVRAYCNALIDEVVSSTDTVDFDAADLRHTHVNGGTVSSWVARRGGLTATATGTPEFRVPTSDMPEPSVYYAASGERHVAGAVDWSAYNVATLIAVWRSELTAGSNGGIVSLHADLTDYPSQSGGIEHLLGASSLYWTALHYPAGAGSYWLERDAIADAGARHVNISVHDTAAKTLADEIRGFQDGAEITGSTTGTSGGGASWQPALYPVIGARGGAANEGLRGRVSRLIASPQDIGVAGAAAVTQALQAIRDTWPR